MPGFPSRAYQPEPSLLRIRHALEQVLFEGTEGRELREDKDSLKGRKLKARLTTRLKRHFRKKVRCVSSREVEVRRAEPAGRNARVLSTYRHWYRLRTPVSDLVCYESHAPIVRLEIREASKTMNQAWTALLVWLARVERSVAKSLWECLTGLAAWGPLSAKAQPLAGR
jgi:hypothetical protein